MPIFQVNKASVVTVCNAKAATMLGYDHDRGGVLGRQLTEFVAAESCAAVQRVLDQALRGGQRLQPNVLEAAPPA